MKLRFNRKYAFLFLGLLLMEVFIALYVKNTFVRGYFGDFLVVILVYCFWRSFFNTDKKKTIIGVVLFAIGVEVLQAFQLVKLLNLENNEIASVIIGNHFDWFDILAYILGGGFIYLIEFWVQIKKGFFS